MRKKKISGNQDRIIRKNIIEALRELTYDPINHHPAKFFNNEGYFRPKAIELQALKVAEETGRAMNLPKSTLRSKVLQTMNHYHDLGEVKYAFGKVETLYRATK